MFNLNKNILYFNVKMFRKGLTFNYIILIFYSVAHAVGGSKGSDPSPQKKILGVLILNLKFLKLTDYTYP